MSMKVCYFFSFIVLMFPANVDSADFLFESGRTSYRIVIPRSASDSEQTAARELKKYLEQISGATFDLSSSGGRRNIYVGYEKSFAIFRGLKPYQNSSEGFTIKKIGHNLVIYGGRERGTMFGVYRFLQEFLGVQWYTPDFTKVPNKNRYD